MRLIGAALCGFVAAYIFKVAANPIQLTGTALAAIALLAAGFQRRRDEW